MMKIFLGCICTLQAYDDIIWFYSLMFQCSWRPFYNPLFTIQITQSKYNNNDKQTKKNLLTFLKNRIWPNTTDLNLYLSLYWR